MARAHSQVEFNNQSGADTKALLGDLLDAVVQLRAERATKAAEPKVIEHQGADIPSADEGQKP
jgi:hypothetical protein